MYRPRKGERGGGEANHIRGSGRVAGVMLKRAGTFFERMCRRGGGGGSARDWLKN